MKKGYLLYIGIIALCLTLAIIQFFMKDYLPMSVYTYVAWTSFLLTLLELIKTINKCIKDNYIKMKENIEVKTDHCIKASIVFSYFRALSEEAEDFKKRGQELKEEAKSLSAKEKKVKKLDKAITWMYVAQILVFFIQFAFVFILKIPNNFSTNKVLFILGLLSFCLIILSILATKINENAIEEIEEKTKIENEIIDFYMHLFNKIIEYKGEQQQDFHISQKCIHEKLSKDWMEDIEKKP